MPHMDDEDSSSAGLSDTSGRGFHSIEVESPNEDPHVAYAKSLKRRARGGQCAGFVEEF